MKNFDFFTTENGVASLLLDQIPYTAKAYVRIRSTVCKEALLEECKDFCRLAGAECVYVTNVEGPHNLRHHTDVVRMQADKEQIPVVADTCIFPVTEETLGQWRDIYNRRMINVPNSTYLTAAAFDSFLKENNAYFIHENGMLLGIGAVGEDSVSALASVYPGAGEKIVRALCEAVFSPTVCLEVASANQKAVSLYERLGFVKTKLVSSWYILYEKDRT